jgi:hypothetical protein
VLVLCQVLAILVMAELAVRIAATKSRELRMVLEASTECTDFSDAETVPELMERTMLGFRPFSVEYGFVLNSRSFRTSEYVPGEKLDGFRVLALGDSFTFASGGLPDRDHWTTMLEHRLQRRTDRKVEVLRLGVPGTGPAFQLRLWQLEGIALEPDVVVLGFFVGNDFVDHQDDCGELCPGTRGFGARLAKASALVRVIRNLVRIRGAAAARTEDRARVSGAESVEPGTAIARYAESFDPDRPTFDRADFVAIETTRMALCRRSETGVFERLLGRVARVVIQLAGEVEDAGARFVVMIIPDQYQIDGQLLDEVLEASGNRLEDYDLDRPQERLVEVLESAGVEVVNLAPVFRALSGPAPLYRPNDSHWNRRGNAVAASVLADLLEPARTEPDGGATGPATVFSGDFESGSIGPWSISSKAD